MNGLIQHLATSGIDLSEDNVLAVSSGKQSVFEEPNFPSVFYALTCGGWNYSLSDDGNYTWGYGVYKITKRPHDFMQVWLVTHKGNNGEYIEFSLEEDNVLYWTIYKASGSYYTSNNAPRIYLKSI